MINYCILLLFPIMLFTKGYFPSLYKVKSDKDEVIYSKKWMPVRSKTNIEKTVLFIIDALRIDFVTQETMPFLSQAFHEKGCFDHVTVDSPTIKIPRLKALIGGCAPDFINIILNLSEYDELEDSLIHRALAKNNRIVFYGDDVWLKLFPQSFLRSKGTSSYFKEDFSENDDLVTTHALRELTRDDWDIMILHYVGLDHIGHVLGEESPYIYTKLKEMDNIFLRIKTELELRYDDVMIIVTSEYGMKDKTGGHGGSSYSETNIPFVVTGWPCKNDSFLQIDIAANMAILLGLEIPDTSIGTIHKSLIGDRPKEEYLNILNYNIAKLRQKTDLCEETIKTATHLHEIFKLNHAESTAVEAFDLYQNCSTMISEKLMQLSTYQDVPSLISAIYLTLFILLKVFNNGLEIWESCIIMFVSSVQLFNLTHVFLIIPIAMCIYEFSYHSTINLSAFKYILIPFLIYPTLYLFSELIAAEYEFWFFVTVTLLVHLFIKDYASSKFDWKWFILVFVLRVVKYLNAIDESPWNNGINFGEWLLQTNNSVLLEIVFLCSLILIYKCCNIVIVEENKLISKFNYLINGLILLFIFLFRNINTMDDIFPSIIFICLFINCYFVKIFTNFWILLITFLLKPHCVLLIPLSFFISRYFHKKFSGTLEITLSHICLMNCMYFLQGNANNLMEADISNIYIKTGFDQITLVFLQLWCHCYALQILCLLLLFKNTEIYKIYALKIILLHQTSRILYSFTAATIFQSSPAVLTTFAPKVLIEISHFGIILLSICYYYLKNWKQYVQFDCSCKDFI